MIIDCSVLCSLLSTWSDFISQELDEVSIIIPVLQIRKLIPRVWRPLALGMGTLGSLTPKATVNLSVPTVWGKGDDCGLGSFQAHLASH